MPDQPPQPEETPEEAPVSVRDSMERAGLANIRRLAIIPVGRRVVRVAPRVTPRLTTTTDIRHPRRGLSRD